MEEGRREYSFEPLSYISSQTLKVITETEETLATGGRDGGNDENTHVAANGRGEEESTDAGGDQGYYTPHRGEESDDKVTYHDARADEGDETLNESTENQNQNDHSFPVFEETSTEFHSNATALATNAGFGSIQKHNQSREIQKLSRMATGSRSRDEIHENDYDQENSIQNDDSKTRSSVKSEFSWMENMAKHFVKGTLNFGTHLVMESVNTGNLFIERVVHATRPRQYLLDRCKGEARFLHPCDVLVIHIRKEDLEQNGKNQPSTMHSTIHSKQSEGNYSASAAQQQQQQQRVRQCILKQYTQFRSKRDINVHRRSSVIRSGTARPPTELRASAVSLHPFHSPNGPQKIRRKSKKGNNQKHKQNRPFARPSDKFCHDENHNKNSNTMTIPAATSSTLANGSSTEPFVHRKQIDNGDPHDRRDKGFQHAAQDDNHVENVRHLTNAMKNNNERNEPPVKVLDDSHRFDPNNIGTNDDDDLLDNDHDLLVDNDWNDEHDDTSSNWSIRPPRPPCFICYVPFPVYTFSPCLEQNAICEYNGTVGCVDPDDIVLRKQLLKIGLLSNLVAFCLTFFACFAISSKFEILRVTAFSVGEMTLIGSFPPQDDLHMYGWSGKTYVGLRVTAFEGRDSIVRNEFGPGKRTFEFSRFCYLAARGNDFSKDECEACGDTSFRLVASCIISLLTLIPSITTNFLRMYPNYDANCQKFFGSIISCISLASSVYTFVEYSNACFASFYDGTIPIMANGTSGEDPDGVTYYYDIDWGPGNGVICMYVATALKIVDIAMSTIVPTPQITRDRAMQQAYEQMYGNKNNGKGTNKQSIDENIDVKDTPTKGEKEDDLHRQDGAHDTNGDSRNRDVDDVESGMAAATTTTAVAATAVATTAVAAANLLP